jgi:lipoate-protein ligase A
MRLPRHDTSLRLSAEPPAEALAADQALLDDPPPAIRWWLPASPAVVLGVGLRPRLAEIVDLERCGQAGVPVLDRRSGGGALLLDEQLLCGAIALPTAVVPRDVTESYGWLGDRLATGLGRLGIDARRVEVAEARADVATLRASAADDPVSRLLLSTCYGALSPHEVVVGAEPAAKLVGLAQVRRRQAALFQFGILLRDQSRLADYLRVEDADTRAALRKELSRRTVGLASLTDRSVAEVVAAVEDATPCAR